MPQVGQEIANISGIDVHINRKNIKNIHLSVLPPDGRVRLAVPTSTQEQSIRLAIINKLSWIREQQSYFEHQPRQSAREMVGGECHYLWGRAHRLSIVQTKGEYTVKVRGDKRLELAVGKTTTTENKFKLLNNFYRQELQNTINRILPKWQKKLSVNVNAVGIKKMKTKWGSCNASARRIWLNLELAKKPPECLEFILVHELIHFYERHHNQRFQSLMNEHLPNWAERRNLLNSLPLANESWRY